MFKVGKKVWIVWYKRYATIKKVLGCLFEIEEDDYFKEGKTFSLNELHQTADDMFEALGFEKSEPLAHIIKYQHKNDGYIFNIYFNMSKQIYSFEDNNKRIMGVNGDEHLAIHQKLIELGWL